MMTVLPLLLCSITALALILEAVVRMITTAGLTQTMLEQINTCIETGTPKNALDCLIDGESFFPTAAKTLKTMVQTPKALRDEATSVALQQDISRLTQRRNGLVTLAALSPMLGLLGTVLGMMGAFQALESHSGPVEPAIVAGGLWQAMITTGVGLGIAAPCVLVSVTLKSWSQNKASRASALLTRLSIALESCGK